MPLKTTSITIKCIVMDFYEVLEKRRTIRDFSNKEVTDEVLEKVLSAALKLRPNDHLRQFEFIVVRGQGKHCPTYITCSGKHQNHSTNPT